MPRRKKLRADELPPACEKCAPYGGYHCIGARGGLQRCDCPRGAILAAASARKPGKRPIAAPAQETGPQPYEPGDNWGGNVWDGGKDD